MTDAEDEVPSISVVVPTHQPDPGRLFRVLDALRAQTLPPGSWECIVVDNASDPAVQLRTDDHARVVREEELGLTSARRKGLMEARSSVCVFVDDDNLLAPDYLERALEFVRSHPDVGAVGGRIVPEFEMPPPAWIGEFQGLLALRENGDVELLSEPSPSQPCGLPAFSPVGAGMVVVRAAVVPWLEQLDSRGDAIPDRRGAALTSGGDSDILFTMVKAGWRVAYTPRLLLRHVVPASRVDVGYLARLNRGIQSSWVRVLWKHKALPWPPIKRWTVPLRVMKAWFVHRAWRGAVHYIRWQGARGHFEARADLS